MSKKCSKCRVLKESSEFQVRTISYDGLTSACKSCLREYEVKDHHKKYAAKIAKRNEEFLKIGGVWRDVVGYEGLYSISDDGKVLNNKRLLLMAINTNKRGYLYTILTKNGERTHHLIHRLGAQAFIPNDEDKPCVNHLDGDKTNNNISNLEWCTYKENMEHAADNKLNARGESIGNSKLTEDSIRAIRDLHKSGNYTNALLGSVFGITGECVSAIILNKTWKHVS